MTNGNSAEIKTLIDKIENCGFECEAGRLEMCIDWQVLKNKLLSVCADGGKDSDMADFIAEDGLSEQFRIWRECRDAAIAGEKK